MAEIVCPADCSTDLPVVAFDKCNPNVVASEITKLYVAKPTAADFTALGLADPLEWGKRISETAVVPGAPENTTPVGDLIRPLSVIGDRPAPATVFKDLSNQRKKILRKDFVINFTIDEISPENLEMQRKSECGMLVKFWYAIQGGLLFGGITGIEAELVMDLVLARGTEEVVAINGTLSWKGKHTEESITNPIAE